MTAPVLQNSSKSVTETMDALVTAVDAAGATIFARVDHAKGAASVNMELPDAQLLIFGNPMLGTAAMKSDIHAGLKLPLRVLVYTGEHGTVIAYESVSQIFDGYRVDPNAEFAQKMAGALAKLTAKAAA